MTAALDAKRQLIEMALNEGRKRESPRTGLIHFHYSDEEATDTIPLYENLCFCLALFRSYNRDHVQEAKEKLTRLLAFDTFPTYLHEYPKTGSFKRLYFPLYWIFTLFSGVIEEPLRTRLKEIVELIYPFKSPSEVRSSEDAASLCLHLQLEGKSLHALAPYWDKELSLYTGPLLQEYQRKNLPETTLFDLFMSSATAHFSKRILAPHPVHMHAALIFPTELIQTKPLSVVSVYTPGEQQQGFHLFRKAWEGNDHLHTLVCQERELQFEANIFTYPKEIPEENRRTELALFCDYHPDVILHVNGEKSTVFELGDSLTIETPNKIITLSFDIAEGEGAFMGHISRGNRPAQVLSTKFAAYDWKIGIRSIRRSSNLKLALHCEEQDYPQRHP